ncbi:DUF882 domain-containing protein [Azospirillum canadense]|uniref:DUF882 domain-containing protein n=1 Tax=Azospirillum canadense TaxID=403962 RepID=UPI0022260D2C|nr:DUF882 domain-containing protein [Azospirillum canadense]MCW2235509.1 uncharacterized protein YcbK (DUF882 family) [Azospirillum canadense]
MMRSFLRLSVLGLLAGGCLAGCASTPAPQVTLAGDQRSITLYHPASGEAVSVTYWRPDGYDRAAMQQISALFRDRRTGETIPVDPALVDMLVELRQRCGAPADTPIYLTSGFRSQATNAALARSNGNVAEHSYHMRAQAADIYMPGVAPRGLADEAAAMQRGGYALYAHTGHVHVDTGPFRTWVPKGGEQRLPPAILEARVNTPYKPPASKTAPALPPALPPVVEVAKVETPQPAPAPVPAVAPPPAPAARETQVAQADLDKLVDSVAEADPVPAPAPAAAPVTVAAQAPAPRKPAPASVNIVAARAAPGSKAEPDLARVRYVLAQLKDQPAPILAVAKRKP